MQQPANPNSLTTPDNQQSQPRPKDRRKPPSPQDLITHYTEQGLEPQAASLKVIEDLQNVLYRMVSSNSSRNKKDKIMIEASKKMDNLNSKLAILNMKVDSKPGFGGVFVIGVASGAAFDGVKTVLPHVFEGSGNIWGAVRSALEQKKKQMKRKNLEQLTMMHLSSQREKIGLVTKIGVGVGVVVFGLLFALGDFIPSVSDSPTKVEQVIDNKLSEEEKTALKGAAVTLTELGEYTRAAPVLQDLAKEKPSDPDILRLLGEVKFSLKDYEGSAAAYKLSAAVSKNIDFDVLRGQTNTLLAAKKPDEAVQIILAARERLNTKTSNSLDIKADGNKEESISQEVDPVQVEMLLGKAYSDWGYLSDAVSSAHI